MMRILLLALLLSTAPVWAAEVTIMTPSGQVASASARVTGTQTGIAKPMWFEVRQGGPEGRITEYGAFPNGPEWFFQVRHLSADANLVKVFGVDEQGALVEADLTLTVPHEGLPAVRPRPVPAEVWWGGLGENQQLTDAAQHCLGRIVRG